MAPYVGIVKKPPTTMTDLKMATAPFKSVVTVLSCSTVPLSFRQQYHPKNPSQTNWNIIPVLRSMYDHRMTPCWQPP